MLFIFPPLDGVFLPLLLQCILTQYVLRLVTVAESLKNVFFFFADLQWLWYEATGAAIIISNNVNLKLKKKSAILWVKIGCPLESGLIIRYRYFLSRQWLMSWGLDHKHCTLLFPQSSSLNMSDACVQVHLLCLLVSPWQRLTVNWV